jgi:hypothetical protein
MTRTPIFTSFYTAGYEAHASRLVTSLKQRQLEFKVERLDLAGDWDAKCNHRARWIAHTLDDYPDRPVVWLDADTIVFQRPNLFFELAEYPGARRYDIAYFRRPQGLVGGVIYAEQTTRDLWQLVQKQEGDEDARLRQAIAAYPKPLRYYPLPPSYHYTPWMMGTLESPLPKSEWVIAHAMEASGRRAKQL